MKNQDNENLLTVGELSKRFGLNVQTLHYYDLIDVFKPNYRNDITGKRGYDLNQVYQLATIRYLRKMGCSIDEIKRYVKNPSPVFIDNLLDKKVKEIKRQMDEIVLIQKAIDRKNSFIESQKAFMDNGQPFIRHFDNRLCLPIGSEDVIYFEDIFYFFPTVVVYDKNGKHFGAYLYDSGKAGFHNSFVRAQNTISIPGGDFLVGYHKGSYETIYEKMLQIRNSRPDLKLDDEMIDFNIIDQFKEVDSDNFVTEINIRILAYEK